MALPSSGQLSMADIAAEFGGVVPHSISEYYGAGGVPASGQIAISDFYGQSSFSGYDGNSTLVFDGSTVAPPEADPTSATMTKPSANRSLFNAMRGTVVMGTAASVGVAYNSNLNYTSSPSEAQIYIKLGGPYPAGTYTLSWLTAQVGGFWSTGQVTILGYTTSAYGTLAQGVQDANKTYIIGGGADSLAITVNAARPYLVVAFRVIRQGNAPAGTAWIRNVSLPA